MIFDRLLLLVRQESKLNPNVQRNIRPVKSEIDFCIIDGILGLTNHRLSFFIIFYSIFENAKKRNRGSN